MSKTVLIICNGEPPGRTLTRRLAKQAGLIVAADGGANVARRYGIRPDIIVGDLDSILGSTRKAFSSSREVHVKRQDNTDLEKALDFVVAEKFTEVVIAGAVGKRLDFTLANLSVMWKYTRRARIRFIGNDWEAMPVESGKKIKVRLGTTVSLIPFVRCSGITLDGLLYPLRNATMGIGQIGVSNVVRRSPFTIHVKRGKLMLIMLGPQSGRRRR